MPLMGIKPMVAEDTSVDNTIEQYSATKEGEEKVEDVTPLNV